MLEVTGSPRGFDLRERALEQPRQKSHDVDWEGLRAASRAVVAEEGDSLIDCAAMSYETWNRRAVISHLYVDRAKRGLGFGAGLLIDVRRYASSHGARCLWVETPNANAPAIRFYMRHGFVLSGLDTSLYDPSEIPDGVALYFTLNLEAE